MPDDSYKVLYSSHREVRRFDLHPRALTCTIDICMTPRFSRGTSGTIIDAITDNGDRYGTDPTSTTRKTVTSSGLIIVFSFGA